ncbi:MAG: hypothetical protein KJN71_03710 [Acidimicrobiia bacterium]|nr:hypothetical protein [Acidimicrobiia bacterium]
MTQTVRCRDCGAENPKGADWCNQCYRPFSDAPRHPDPVVAEAVTAVEERQSDTDWICRVCGSTNPIETSVCTKCAHEIYDSFSEPRHRPDPPPWWSLAIPGGGLFSVGMPLAGAAVIGLVALAAGFGVLFITGGRPIGWLFITAAVVLWVVAARDSLAVSGGDNDILLRPRVVSIVAVVMFAAIIFVLVEALQAVQDSVTE